MRLPAPSKEHTLKPGPGAYDVRKDPGEGQIGSRQGGAGAVYSPQGVAPFGSRADRMEGSMMGSERSSPKVGPGQYGIPKQLFSTTFKRADPWVKAPPLTGMGKKTGVPGPGSYELAELWPQKPKPNAPRGRGKSTEDAPRERPRTSSPGMMAYQSDDMYGFSMSEMVRRRNRKSKARSQMLSTTDRWTSFGSIGRSLKSQAPPPDTYDPDASFLSETATLSGMEGAFRSTSERFAGSSTPGPGPASWDGSITESQRDFDLYTSVISPRVKQKTAAPKGFGTLNDRFPAGYVYGVRVKAGESPTPDRYMLPPERPKGESGMKSKEERPWNVRPKDTGLGPGTYIVEKPLLRKTFNRSRGKRVVPSKSSVF